jgi:hypothetical protein
MNDIKAAFTKREFKVLLEQMLVGSILQLDSDEKKTAEINALMQKLLKVARDAKVYQTIEYDELQDEFFMPIEVEDDVLEMIDDYDEDIFMEKLFDEFVARDIQKKYNPRMLANMTEEKYNELYAIEEEKYIKEINENGLEKLRFL